MAPKGFKKPEEVLNALKRGEIHAVIFAVDHGDPWHHQAINEFMKKATEQRVPVQLLEESLNEEKVRVNKYLQKLATVKELGRVAKKHGVVSKDLYLLSTEEAIRAEQRALEQAVQKLEAGDRKNAELLYNLARAIEKFRKPHVRERYLVFERLKNWNAQAADSGTIKDMMRIAIQKGYKYDPLWKTRNLTMFKNMKKALAAKKIPVLVTGALHAEDIQRLAKKHGLKVAVIRPPSEASPGEKWIDSREYRKFVKGARQ